MFEMLTVCIGLRLCKLVNVYKTHFRRACFVITGGPTFQNKKKCLLLIFGYHSQHRIQNKALNNGYLERNRKNK